jgi:thioredoxin 1
MVAKKLMATINSTSEQFDSLVKKPGITFVDFWAAWCGPCRSFAPIFEKASEKFPDIQFVKVDTDAERALASAAQIASIPTLMAFRDGILVFRQPGALPESAFSELINAVQGLDMEEVKKEIAKSQN